MKSARATASGQSRGRIVWIDAAKGVGILSVAAGHILTGVPTIVWALYLFHMPFFFMISGLLYRPQAQDRFIRQKAKSLLIPYIFFLIVLGLPPVLAAALYGDRRATMIGLIDLPLGGSLLHGTLGAFWFVTCLYIAQLAYNAAIIRNRSPFAPAVLLVVSACLLFSVLVTVLGITRNPWGILSVPAAIFYLWLGHIVGERASENRLGFVAVILGIVALCIWLQSLGVHFYFDMKFAQFGPPLIGLALAAALSLVALSVCRLLGRIGAIARPLAHVGQASLAILLLHQAINVFLRSTTQLDSWAVLVVAVCAPLALDWIGRSYPPLQMIGLGSGAAARALSPDRPAVS